MATAIQFEQPPDETDFVKRVRTYAKLARQHKELVMQMDTIRDRLGDTIPSWALKADPRDADWWEKTHPGELSAETLAEMRAAIPVFELTGLARLTDRVEANEKRQDRLGDHEAFVEARCETLAGKLAQVELCIEYLGKVGDPDEDWTVVATNEGLRALSELRAELTGED